MPKKGEFSLLEKIDTEEDWLNLANKEVGQNVIFSPSKWISFLLQTSVKQTYSMLCQNLNIENHGRPFHEKNTNFSVR